MNCYKCKHPNLHGSNFCEKCGSDLKSPPPQRSEPTRSYSSYQAGPANYAPRRGPSPRPSRAPAPRPANAPAPTPVPPPKENKPAPQVPTTPPERRRSPIVSSREISTGKSEQAKPLRREPVPFGRLVASSAQELFLRYDENLIGRASSELGTPQIDLSQLDRSGTVSRRHARIGKDDNSIFLEDLGSSNGTRLNGKSLQKGLQAPLSHGDQIIFGDLIFTLHLD